jgi:hypothetical protein
MRIAQDRGTSPSRSSLLASECAEPATASLLRELAVAADFEVSAAADFLKTE